VAVKLVNEFSGFAEEATASKISDVWPWLQDAIHLNLSQSKHEVKRRGEKWKPKRFGRGIKPLMESRSRTEARNEP
jgi:hypothetical protein